MNKKNTQRGLFYSVISLLLCVSMLVGTTLAWFSDSVSSTGNIIKTGRLDVTMEYANDLSGEWKDASEATIFSGNLWEPGYSDMKFIKVSNTGNLAFNYQMHILPAVQATGEVDLADVIDVYVGVVEEGFEVPAAFSAEMAGLSRQGTLAEVMAAEPATGILLPVGADSSNLSGADVGEVTYCVLLHMQETAGNEYQNLTVGNNFTIQLVATQMGYERDSFGNSYDANADWPYLGVNFTFVLPIEGLVDPETSCLTEAVMIGDVTDAQYAVIPAGVKVAEGVESLTLKVTAMEKTTANVRTRTRDEILRSVDIHVEGVAEDNTVPMTFGLEELFPAGLNDNNVKLFHVEDGETKEMTIVDTPVNHNEFSYDPLTGNAVLTIASFSEVATYADTDAGWDGKTFDYDWYKADGDLTIASANQFAAFRNIVDGVEVNGTYIQDDFKGQKITLAADINLAGHNFDPIGWGYENAAWNKDGADGKVFKGTFDGDGHTIYGLYQDGWDLGYSYTNCGFGLFAAACDATFEDLTIDGADIRVECVETGVLVGLAQGNCTFKNINILGCKAANYQRPVGGVVGEVSPDVNADASTHTFDNIKIDSNTVIGSLWGDFDAPVGGVIGAYWDDDGKTYVDMKNVIVACELDVYNDVTSTYQWYAYRRAGMLIGNSDRVAADDAHKAAATYLTCSNVIVFYGNWANYHYCEFYDSNPNWPWVRVEPGENCSGYSNPRWGRAKDPVTGADVVDSVHNHGKGEDGNGESHMESIPFHQLYGGGQGVYGAEQHPTGGVKEGIYTVTYMDHGEILHVDYVTDNTVAYDCEHAAGTGVWPISNVVAANNEKAEKWVDANGKDFTGVDAGNTANVTVYPKWPNEYAIRCLDTYGNVVYYNFAKSNSTDAYLGDIATEINKNLETIQKKVDEGGKVLRVKWKHPDGKLYSEITAANLKSSSADVVLVATPQLLSGSITLTPVYDEITGELIAYHVTDVVADDSNISIMIPDYVGTVPVTKIVEGAFDDFDNLHAIVIPNTVTTLDKSMFPGTATAILADRQTITIYYEGTKASWDAMEKVDAVDKGSWFLDPDKDISWDNSLGKESRVFFLDASGKVDITQGYYEVTKIEGSSPSDVIWTYYPTITQDMKNKCTANCNCKEVCNNQKQRPDAIYWEGVEIN